MYIMDTYPPLVVKNQIAGRSLNRLTISIFTENVYSFSASKYE